MSMMFGIMGHGLGGTGLGGGERNSMYKMAPVHEAKMAFQRKSAHARMVQDTSRTSAIGTLGAANRALPHLGHSPYAHGMKEQELQQQNQASSSTAAAGQMVPKRQLVLPLLDEEHLKTLVGEASEIEPELAEKIREAAHFVKSVFHQASEADRTLVDEDGEEATISYPVLKAILERLGAEAGVEADRCLSEEEKEETAGINLPRFIDLFVHLSVQASANPLILLKAHQTASARKGGAAGNSRASHSIAHNHNTGHLGQSGTHAGVHSGAHGSAQGGAHGGAHAAASRSSAFAGAKGGHVENKEEGGLGQKRGHVHHGLVRGRSTMEHSAIGAGLTDADREDLRLASTRHLKEITRKQGIVAGWTRAAGQRMTAR
mmetsp:Transcript_83159/g.178290  ORF Transcript_83159/g.178290 Transcript_83159/m.178290 type:complete len:375 (+) Transcript_83159:105-1229(+)